MENKNSNSFDLKNNFDKLAPLLTLGRQKAIIHMLSQLLSEKTKDDPKDIFDHYIKMGTKEAEILAQELGLK